MSSETIKEGGDAIVSSDTLESLSEDEYEIVQVYSEDVRSEEEPARKSKEPPGQEITEDQDDIVEEEIVDEEIVDEEDIEDSQIDGRRLNEPEKLSKPSRLNDSRVLKRIGEEEEIRDESEEKDNIELTEEEMACLDETIEVAQDASESTKVDSTKKRRNQKGFYGKKASTESTGDSPSTSRWKNRPMPSFKLIPEVDFVVDGFKYKNSRYDTYFLTHFHSDHYGGLYKSFKEGTIYCTPITAQLVIKQLKVHPQYVKSLEMNVVHHIRGVDVIMMDANHCPGAAIILFKVKGSYYLHTGDFRYDPKMKLYGPLQGIEIEGLYLDNTFCNPKYVFPPQSTAISEVLSVVKKERGKSTLFLVGSYSIGKEKVFLQIAREFNMKIFVTPEKYELLSCYMTEQDLNKYITMNPSESDVHVVAMGFLNFKRLWELHQKCKNKYDKIVAFQPTGWSFGKTIQSVTKKTAGALEIYGVPYSEHSNYNELREFVSWIKPRVIIPTVDCDTPEKVKDILSHFTQLPPDHSKSSLLPYFNKIKSTISSLFTSSPSPSILKEQEMILESIKIKRELKVEEMNSPPPLFDPTEEMTQDSLNESQGSEGISEASSFSQVSSSFSQTSTSTSINGSQMEPIDLDTPGDLLVQEQRRILESIQKTPNRKNVSGGKRKMTQKEERKGKKGKTRGTVLSPNGETNVNKQTSLLNFLRPSPKK